MDTKAVNMDSLVEKEKKIRKEQHREWMLNNDERYQTYHSLMKHE